MDRFYELTLGLSRNWIRSLPEAERPAQARRDVKLLLVPHGFTGSDADVPDFLADDAMVRRYLEIDPPWASLIAEFRPIVGEIEASYVMGHYFSALTSSCVAIERLLNDARMKLHKHHKKMKALWNKGPVADWRSNIEALEKWGYLTPQHAKELRSLYAEVRGRYLHSGSLDRLAEDSLRAVRAAYKVIALFLGFPPDLFEIRDGRILCKDPTDPRFKEFYQPVLKSAAHNDVPSDADPGN